MPRRGEIWLADLDPIQGHEQGGQRPCLVLSDNTFNLGPAGLVVVLPLTSKQRNIPLHVPVEIPEGGLKTRSYIMPEMIRSISVDRLIKRWGQVSPERLHKVETNLRVLLSI